MVEKFKEINEILKEIEEKAEIVSGKLTECLNEFENEKFTEEELSLIDKMNDTVERIEKLIFG